METIELILIVAMIALIVLYIISTMLIFNYLKKKGEKVSFLWLRLFMISYANKYKEITKKEKGKTGPLFYWWILSINLTLILLAIYIIFL